MTVMRTIFIVITAGVLAGIPVFAAEPIQIGSQRELFVDDYLIEKLDGAERRMHHPTPREIAITFDEPWEGNLSVNATIFQDGDRYRMYYRGQQINLEGERRFSRDPVACYAESPDGIHWHKPKLGLFQFNGSKENNIIWRRSGVHNFAPFKDPNPDAPEAARYKAVGGLHDLHAFVSPDGLRWTPLETPALTAEQGKFDSLNAAFWDPLRNHYRIYFRDYREGRRDIKTATSEDFVHWSDPVWLEYPGAAQEQLYENVIKPYFRAPHVYLGFPTRYLDRGWAPGAEQLPGLEHRKKRASISRRYGTALTDTLLMSSRDGRTFYRWSEAFLRPGPERADNWVYGDQYVARHLVQTSSAVEGATPELSLYATEGAWTGEEVRLRRYSLRLDGFVSVHAPRLGGELLTKTIIFQGDELAINFATSIAGSVRVEMQTEDGEAIPGFSAAECPEIFGDHPERIVKWKGAAKLSTLAGKPVRLRFILKDADIYSFRFRYFQ